MEIQNVILKTGFQEMNNMLDGGFKRGSLIRIAGQSDIWKTDFALCFKTSFALSLTMDMILNNKPVMIDETKKPVILFICPEAFVLELSELFKERFNLINKQNEINQLFNFVTKIKETGEFDYKTGKFSDSEYQLRMLKVNCDDGVGIKDAEDIKNMIFCQEHICGYEVHAVVMDSLLFYPIAPNNTVQQTIKDMFKELKEYCSSKGITFISTLHVFKDLSLSESVGLDLLLQESRSNFDVDLVTTTPIINNQKYFTVVKHELINDGSTTSCCYKLPENGQILPDINGENQSVIVKIPEEEINVD